MNICMCCLIEVSDKDCVEINWARRVDGVSYSSGNISVCIACFRLGCDAMATDGCKRPESQVPA